jgi:hypothetical protein
VLECWSVGVLFREKTWPLIQTKFDTESWNFALIRSVLAAQNGERASRLSEDRPVILKILGSRVQPADRPANYTAAPVLETVSFLRRFTAQRCLHVSTDISEQPFPLSNRH